MQTKRDKNNKTGGEPQEFDDIDELVLQILGKKSPVVEGLPVNESMAIAQPRGFSYVEMMNTESVEESGVSGTTPRKCEATRSSSKRQMDNLSERRLRLQNRKLELEILGLERDLDVEHVDIYNTNLFVL